MPSTFDHTTSVDSEDNNHQSSAALRMAADVSTPDFDPEAVTTIVLEYLNTHLEHERRRTAEVFGEHDSDTDVVEDASDIDEVETLVNDSRSPSPEPSQPRSRTRNSAEECWSSQNLPDSTTYTPSAEITRDLRIPERIVLDLHAPTLTPTLVEILGSSTKPSWQYFAHDIERLRTHFLAQKLLEEMTFGERVQWLINDMYPTTLPPNYVKPPPGLFRSFYELYLAWESQPSPRPRQPIKVPVYIGRRRRQEKPSWIWKMLGFGLDASGGKRKERTGETLMRDLKEYERRPLKRLRTG